ncbi:quinolinate synthase NadA, partial [Vibrio parahaemolyticus]|nr:quinolinate synthase NadA [Vibrio parahaemolyticus]
MSHILDKIDTVYPFPPKPIPLSEEEKSSYIASIKELLKQKDAVLIAHYYTDPEI